MKMTKKKTIIWVILGLSIIGLILSGYFVFSKNKQQDDKVVAAGLVALLNNEKNSFSGNIEVTDKYKYQIKFTSTVTKDSSITDFELSAPDSLGNLMVSGKMLSVKNSSYIKFSDVTSELSKLPKDPLSLAIKNNLTPIAKKYQDQWLRLPENKGLSEQGGCLDKLMKISNDQQDLNRSYSDSPFINIKSKSRTTVNGKDAVVYDVVLNDKVAEFLKSSGLELDNEVDKCLNTEFTLEVTLDKADKSVVAVNYSDDKVKAEISIDQSSDESSISVPKSSKSFTELEDELKGLFLN